MFVATGDRKESEPFTSSSVEWSEPCRHFEFSEIQLATENFNESLVIGSGGFGKVYKGHVINGSDLVVAAIKRLDSMSIQGADEFWAEVELLSKLRHYNLVSLFGYCNYEGEMILVYEYLPNGTLEDHLHKLSTPVSWIQRLKICIDAGRGLDYLHTGTGIGSGVIHRDVKSSNILLDETWAAKVSDFGLSKIGPMNQPSTYINTRVKGTHGYLDLDYVQTGRLTKRSDVYAFGVVLLEVLCRKRAVDTTLVDDQWTNLAEWAQECIKDGNLKHIIDSDIRGEIHPKCLKKFVQIAERCLQLNRKLRPTMADVVVSLESVLTLQEKIIKSLQSSGGSILGKMRDMVSFSSNGENSVLGKMLYMVSFSSNGENSGQRGSKLLSNSKDNHRNHRIRAPIEIIILPRPNLRVFSFAELKAATRNFRPDTLLGEGGFGKVYKGWLEDKSNPETNVIAVKKLNSKSRQGFEEWQAEVNFLGRLSHPNLVKLLGYCNEGTELLLVYEFMQKGSLENHLFRRGSTIQPLPWDIRLKISIGAAQGLASLHTSQTQIIYRDFKTSNILLDGAYNAKLSDFGLAKIGPSATESHVSTRVMGTYGYAAPEYISTGHLYVKSDVYSFGMVLVEILTGMRAVDGSRPAAQKKLSDWVKPYLVHRTKLKNIMDSRLERKYPLKAAVQVARLALTCLETEPKTRPSMEEVVEKLEQLYAIN